MCIRDSLTIKIGERTLLEPFTYTVCRGQRLVIAGPNGAGKSTLMQVLDGKRRPSGGMVRLGTGARPSIFAQQQNRLGQGRVIDVIWNKYPRMTELEVRSHLAKLGFRGDTVFKPCEALSGGELARIMLAMKNVLAEQDAIPTLIFDEVDAGVSGRAAQKVAEKLWAVAQAGKQVLCVTHLPQLAAMADTHFSVEKGEENGRTFTRVVELDRAQRCAELARLTGGAAATETQLRGAEELLSAADAFRRAL